MSLLLVRHGETSLNIARVLQPAATPLSDKGHRQAAALAHRLASMGLGAIVSSDLPRALQTAQHLAQATDLPIIKTPLLQERSFGDLRGHAYDRLEVDPIQMIEAPPGGESMAAFEQRVAAAFAHLVDLRSAMQRPLVVVSHGLVISVLLRLHARQRANGPPLPVRLRNCSLSIVAAAAPFEIELLDCTAHLAGDLIEPPCSLSGG
ncbi:MAG: histidine phosphatase family protein [Ideonella sp.]